MDRPNLEVLLEKYRRGECSEDELELIHDWYDRLDQGETISLSDRERAEMEQKIWRNMQPDLEEEGWQVKKSRMVNLRYLVGVAATLLLIAGFVISQNYRTVNLAMHKTTVREMNSSDQLKKLVLTDGSVVTLTPGSALTYPKEFTGKEREVSLEGDAFFEITKNPDRPFLVKKGRLVTKVLGTSFWIRSNKKAGTLEVAVVTGKVTVFEQEEAEKNVAELSPNAILVIPHEKAVYNTTSGEIQRSQVKMQLPKPETGQPGELVAENLPISEILAHFKVLYGVDVEVAKPEMARCSFTGDLRNMQFYDALELLCKSVNASYQSLDDWILITGEGCQQ